MRAVVQRVSRAAVRLFEDAGGGEAGMQRSSSGSRVAGQIGRGLLVLLGVAHGDNDQTADWLAEKTAHLRIFEDEAGRMNRSVLDVGGAALVVSQFTLLGDARHGRRPDFTRAARPEVAEPLYGRYCERLASFGVRVARGIFRAKMEVELVNDGPVTILLEAP